MTKTYSGLVHLNGNLLASIDLETTGLKAGYHEPIQIAVVPLNSDIRPLEVVRPFYTTVRPEFPERQEKRVGYVHGISLEDLVLHAPDAGKVADLLVEWWEKLDLPVNKTLVPLAHNWAFESKFLQAWLGVDLTNTLFSGHARDAMLYALALNDKAAFMGLPAPFARVGLGSICKRFNIVNPNPHDALRRQFRRLRIEGFSLTVSQVRRRNRVGTGSTWKTSFSMHRKPCSAVGHPCDPRPASCSRRDRQVCTGLDSIRENEAPALPVGAYGEGVLCTHRVGHFELIAVVYGHVAGIEQSGGPQVVARGRVVALGLGVGPAAGKDALHGSAGGDVEDRDGGVGDGLAGGGTAC